MILRTVLANQTLGLHSAAIRDQFVLIANQRCWTWPAPLPLQSTNFPTSQTVEQR